MAKYIFNFRVVKFHANVEPDATPLINQMIIVAIGVATVNVEIFAGLHFRDFSPIKRSLAQRIFPRLRYISQSTQRFTHIGVRPLC